MIVLTLTDSGRRKLVGVPASNTLSVRILKVLSDQKSATLDDISSELRVSKKAVLSTSRDLHRRGLVRKTE